MFESTFISLILISVVSSQISNLDECKRFELCETDADCHGGTCLRYIGLPIMPKSCRCDIPAKTTTTKIYYDMCIPDKKCDDWPGNCGEAIGAGICNDVVRKFK